MSVVLQLCMFLKVCGCRLNCSECVNVAGDQGYIRSHKQENYDVVCQITINRKVSYIKSWNVILCRVQKCFFLQKCLNKMHHICRTRFFSVWKRVLEYYSVKPDVICVVCVCARY